MQRSSVLIISRMSPRRNSRTRNLASALAAKFDVTVVAGRVESAAPFDLGPHVKLREVPLLWPHLSWFHVLGAFRVAHLCLRGLVETPRHDVVVCSDTAYAMPLCIAKALFRKVTVLNAHEISWALGANRFISGLLKRAEAVVLRMCDFFLVPSERRGQIMAEAHQLETPYLVYENLPAEPDARDGEEEIRPRLRRSRPVVQFQGDVCAGRGLHELVEASRDGTFNLVIQGSGRLLPELRQLCHEYVQFLDPCSNDRVVASLAEADLAFVYYENDCLNSAWACSSKFYAGVFAEIPVICNRLPAFEVFAQQWGGCVLLDSLDPAEIRRKVRDIMSAPVSYERLAGEMTAAHQHCRRHRSLDHVVARFEQTLEARGSRRAVDPVTGS